MNRQEHEQNIKLALRHEFRRRPFRFIGRMLIWTPIIFAWLLWYSAKKFVAVTIDIVKGLE